MMMGFLIKRALLRFGVVVQDVKFDVDNECVLVNYLIHRKSQSKSFRFSEIEALFTSDSRGLAARLGNNNGPPGP